VEVELCGPNVLMGCTCALQIARAPAMAVLGGSTGALSPIQRQVKYKPQAKGEIPQTYIKCSYTHMMAATSYPTSPHDPIPASIHDHNHNHTSTPPSHARNPSPAQRSLALPSNGPRHTNLGAPRSRQTPAHAPCPRPRGFPARA
jgi:hypothetical protein